MAFYDEDTVDEIRIDSISDRPLAFDTVEFNVDVAALTNTGKVRSKNEDQFVALRRTRSSEVLTSSLANATDYTGADEHAWLLAVADGLGGHTSGEVASAKTIEAILSCASVLSSWVMRPTNGMLREDLEQRISLYASAIQRELKKLSDGDRDLAGMATTLTAAYIVGATAYILNVGDSRSYIIRDNEIRQITHDHTVAQHMIDDGVDVASTDRFRNVLTRTFSTNDKHVSVDLFQVALSEGDQILLCSDGLTDMVSDSAIQRIVSASDFSKQACEKLVAAALDQGGRDNVTVVLASLLAS